MLHYKTFSLRIKLIRYLGTKNLIFAPNFQTL